MNELEKQELADLVSKFARKEGVNNTPINGIYCIKTTKIQRIVPRIYDPSLCIIVQGRKQALLAEELYQYEPADYLIVSVDLPMIGRVIEASPEKPYLCMKIELDLQLISELLLEIDVGVDKSEGLSTSTNQLDKAESIQSDKTKSRGIFVGKLDETLSESILRLARLMTSADDIPFLSPLMIREVYYRFLKSDYGEAIAQIALNGTTLQRIALVIQQLKADLSSPISVKALAKLAGMSVSTFHVHFKTVTAMSPLQFQKRLRLIEARQLMLADALDVADTAYRVGYESPSQFNREYTRMFGNSPRRDISYLRQQIQNDANGAKENRTVIN